MPKGVSQFWSTAESNLVKVSKATKLYIAGFVLFALAVLVFIQAAFNLNSFLSPSEPNQILLLYTVSTLIFLVLIVFGFVLARTLIKVWVERKQQKPGSKFKTSLLTAMISLTLVPAALLFLFAFGLVNRSIDKWFSVPVDGIFRASGEIGQQWRMEHESMGRSILEHLGKEFPFDLDSARETFRMRLLILLDNDGRIIERSAEPGPNPESIGKAVAATIRNRDEVFLESEAHWVAARRVRTAEGDRILAAVFPTPPEISELTAEIANENETYGKLIQDRKSYRDTSVYMLALMTVLVLFAAVWIGLFLSKRITTPIAALSEATREISAGNLAHRVDVRAEHELGMLVKLFNDMAERLQETTQELEARRRSMEIILESIPTGVISIDPDLRVNKMNRAARTMFPSEQATSLEQIFAAEDLRAICELLEDARGDSVTREITFVGGTPPGRPPHTAVTACRLTAGGVGGFVLVFEDLTEVIRAQKASAWREVARRLAHEIKNPLTPIQLSAERIARNIARLPAASPRVSTVIEECVEAIIQEVSSLKHLVDEFVRFARLPAVSRVPANLKELVDRTMALYDDRLNGTQVILDLPDDLPLILMDSIQMKRVLVNLIDNALESLSSEPVQELRISCELARDNTMARLTIADSGRGIAPEDRERLFTPYFSTRKNGTGLGLAISSRIVADHGGYIGIEPNSPKGTRFVIELPVCLGS